MLWTWACKVETLGTWPLCMGRSLTPSVLISAHFECNASRTLAILGWHDLTATRTVRFCISLGGPCFLVRSLLLSSGTNMLPSPQQHPMATCSTLQRDKKNSNIHLSDCRDGRQRKGTSTTSTVASANSNPNYSNGTTAQSRKSFPALLDVIKTAAIYTSSSGIQKGGEFCMHIVVLQRLPLDCCHMRQPNATERHRRSPIQ
jgi:hypothetical protein